MSTQIGNAILANNSNALRTAVLSATAQRPSTDIRLMSKATQGRGKIQLTGSYTGASDSVIDIEVLGGAGGTLSASTPVVRGVGSGTINVTGIVVGAVPQTIIFSLINPGDRADHAVLDFYGVQLAVKTAGAAGNAATLSVARNLVTADLPFATLEEIKAGTAAWTGEQWNWGGAAETQGSIPATAPRIQFAGFPTIHRAYKKWENAAWTHKIDPAPAYDIPAGTRLLSVAGDYTLILSLGAVSEVYTAVTLYEFLQQVAARSSIINVLGAVAEDRAPGGMAVTDIPLHTDAHAMPYSKLLKNGKGGLSNVTAGASAPTENVTLRYRGISRDWSVIGDVSGRIGTALTGQAFSSTVLGFTIKSATTEADVGGKISAKVELVARDAEKGEKYPGVCFNPLKLGSNATDKTITFTYKARQAEDCPCTGLPVGNISDTCLGLGDDTDMSTLDPAHQSRLIALHSWFADFVSSNTAITDIPTGSTGFQEGVGHSLATKKIKADSGAIAIAKIAVSSYSETLAQIYDNSIAIAQWDSYFTQLDTFMLALETLGEATDLANTTQPIVHVGLSNRNFEKAAKDLFDSKMGHCLALAGILPKSNASNGTGDGCWRDDKSATYWWVADDPDYLPAISNQVYVSSTLIDGAAFSTLEFGFGLEVTCPDSLKEGDKFTIKIGNTAGAGYVDGDQFVIPLVRAAAAAFAGGEDSDPTQTWAVASSVSGALPNWFYNPLAPTPYSDLITADLVPGGIPFEAGDSIAVTLEGGQMRWRRDGGAWAILDIYANMPHSLGDGLTLATMPGAAPSFVTGDTWQYKALATYSLDRLRQPLPGQGYAWVGSTTTITINMGSMQKCELVALALHDLPSGAVITLDGAPMQWREGVMLSYVAGRTATTLTLAISNAGAGGTIGWIYVGDGWRPTVGASEFVLKRQTSLIRGQGLNPDALYRGSGMGGVIAWDINNKSGLDASCADELDVLLRHLFRQGVEPCIVIADVLNPRPALVVIDTDAVEFNDAFGWQRGDDLARVSVSLPLRGVML